MGGHKNETTNQIHFWGLIAQFIEDSITIYIYMYVHVYVHVHVYVYVYIYIYIYYIYIYINVFRSPPKDRKDKSY